MHNVSGHLRSRLSTLGELSRPLGEARAASLARAIANNLLCDVSQGRDPERTMDDWLTRIACEIAAKSQEQRKPVIASGHRVRPVGDLLPEV